MYANCASQLTLKEPPMSAMVKSRSRRILIQIDWEKKWDLGKGNTKIFQVFKENVTFDSHFFFYNFTGSEKKCANFKKAYCWK